MIDFSRRRIMKALGIGKEDASGEVYEIVTPQFERGDDIDPADASDFDRWDELADWRPGVKRSIGMRKWATEDGRTLWLFPYEWREDIPRGFEVTSISWETHEYDPEEWTDKRFGVLACGVVSDD